MVGSLKVGMVDERIRGDSDMSQKTMVMSPEGTSRLLAASLNARPQTLAGCTLGILENHKEFSDWVLDRIRDRLQAEVDIKAVIQLRKHHLAQPAAEHLIDALTEQCDVILVGVGH